MIHLNYLVIEKTIHTLESYTSHSLEWMKRYKNVSINASIVLIAFRLSIHHMETDYIYIIYPSITNQHIRTMHDIFVQTR